MMMMLMLLSVLMGQLSSDGHISVVSGQSRGHSSLVSPLILPRIRHKTFAFTDENQLPQALEAKSKPKSILEKLVREPELGNNI